MRSTKKRVFSVLIALTLCCMTVVSAAAIDTPWLPLEPDGGGSESTATTEDPNGAGDSAASDPAASSEAQNGANASQSSEREETSSAPQSQQTGNSRTEEAMATESSKGCNSLASGFGWLVVIGGAWMLCGTKHAEKKEVNK